jgi:tetratricopeptide (TPR) repeat protein
MGEGARTRAGASRARRLPILLGAAGLGCAAIAAAVLVTGGWSAARHEPSASGSRAAREADRAYITGLGAYHQRDWARAISSFEEALSHEPDHPDAREHLDLALAEDRNQQTLARARAAFEAGRAAEAAALATTIPATSVYSAEALELRRRASPAPSTSPAPPEPGPP